MSYSLCCSYTFRTLDNGNRAKCAMLLFAGYIDAATSMSESCGGGSTPSSSWGRMMKMTGSLPTVARRWLIPCASLNHAAEVFTDKSMKYGNQKKQDNASSG